MKENIIIFTNDFNIPWSEIFYYNDKHINYNNNDEGYSVQYSTFETVYGNI